MPECQIEPQAGPLLTFELDYTHQHDAGTPFSSVFCVYACLWWVFIHLPVVSVRILEAAMQRKCMGRVCHLAHFKHRGCVFLFWFAKLQDRVHGPAVRI